MANLLAVSVNYFKISAFITSILKKIIMHSTFAHFFLHLCPEI